jgi:LacI family transcriptional regulator
MEQRPKPTIHDVARAAGVSAQTVSRVVNQRPDVAGNTRARVAQTIKDLGYQPSGIARSLRLKFTGSFGLILPDSANPFFAELGRAVEEASYQRGFRLFLCNTDGKPEREALYLESLARQQVEGVILIAAEHGSNLDWIRDAPFPLVIVDRELEIDDLDCVLVDNVEGARIATSYLLSLGHRRVACITSLPGLRLSTERKAGYALAMAQGNIEVDEDLIVPGNFQFSGGYRAMKRLLDLPCPPTAVFACNDLLAVGAIAACFDSGRKVPDDISVIGFDDIPLASFLQPRLTTMAQPCCRMGYQAVDFLIQRLLEPDSPRRCAILSTTLIKRDSCAQRRVE